MRRPSVPPVVSARALCAVLLLACCAPASAAERVFRSVDEQGRPVFSDRPPSHDPAEADKAAVEIDLGQQNVYAPAAGTGYDGRGSRLTGDPATAPTGRYAAVRIVSPAEGEAIRSNAGQVVIAVETQPSLQDSDRIQLLLDGRPVSEPVTAMPIVLDNVDRGTHSAVARVVGPEGEDRGSSPAVSFHVMRASVLH